MFRQGSRLHSFTIPSLVETIINDDNSDEPKVACINFGLGGTCCSEALHLLIHKALELGIPNDVIFYDGGNCASYLPLQYFAETDETSHRYLIHKGEISLHLEQNLYLASSFNPNYLIYRAIKIYLH